MARLSGAGTARLIAFEIVPYMLSYISLAFVLQLATAILAEAGLSLLGLGPSNAVSLGIKDERFDRDVHVHVPAGAIPKDGPSAGVTMATALVSALSERPARHDIAMTGEITLSGRVLPIGGVKEKVLGAVRAGIHRVLLPQENVADLEDLPEDVRARLEVYPATELGAVAIRATRSA